MNIIKRKKRNKVYIVVRVVECVHVFFIFLGGKTFDQEDSNVVFNVCHVMFWIPIVFNRVLIVINTFRFFRADTLFTLCRRLVGARNDDTIE